MQYYISARTYATYKLRVHELLAKGLVLERKPVYTPFKEPERSIRFRVLRCRREQLIGEFDEHELSLLTLGMD